MGYKTKNGEIISWKEFFNRWKKGMQEITPQQKTNTQLLFTKIILFGIFCGFCVSVYNFKVGWWLAIILFAAFGNTFVQLLSLLQQKKVFDDLEKQFRKSEKEVQE